MRKKAAACKSARRPSAGRRIPHDEIAAKLRNFDAMQQAALDRYGHEHAPKRDGWAGFIAAMRARFAPNQAAEEEPARRSPRDIRSPARDDARGLPRDPQ